MGKFALNHGFFKGFWRLGFYLSFLGAFVSIEASAQTPRANDVSKKEFCQQIGQKSQQMSFLISFGEKNVISGNCVRQLPALQQKLRAHAQSQKEFCEVLQKEFPKVQEMQVIAKKHSDLASAEIQRRVNNMRSSDFQGVGQFTQQQGNKALQNARTEVRSTIVDPHEAKQEPLKKLRQELDELAQSFPRPCVGSQTLIETNQRMHRESIEFLAANWDKMKEYYDYGTFVINQEYAKISVSGQGFQLSFNQGGTNREAMGSLNGGARAGGSSVSSPSPAAARNNGNSGGNLNGSGRSISPAIDTAAIPSQQAITPLAEGAGGSLDNLGSATSAAESLLSGLAQKPNSPNAPAKEDIGALASKLNKNLGNDDEALLAVFRARNYGGAGGEIKEASRAYIEQVVGRPVTDDELKYLDRYVFSKAITQDKHVIGAAAAAIATVPYEGLKMLCQNVLGGTDVVNYWARKASPGSSISCAGSEAQLGAVTNTFRGIASGFMNR